MESFLSDIIQKDGEKMGRTMVIDRLAFGNYEDMSFLSPYFNILKIGWTLPNLLDEQTLRSRVSKFREHSLHVSNGGTLLEVAVSRMRHIDAIRKLIDTGFDTIELSEGTIDIPDRIKMEIAEFVHSNGLKLNFEVGKKNPRNQLSLTETIERANAAMDLKPDLIIIEGRESGRSVEIYDDNGEIKWDWVTSILESVSLEKIMFEAPMEKQQIEFVIRLGYEVNLGNVDIRSVAALETQRRGLRGDTFGIFRDSSNVTGAPATKFVYYVISNRGPIDQNSIIQITGLKRKTVQNSIKSLIENGLIRETVDRNDLRKKVYLLNLLRK